MDREGGIDLMGLQGLELAVFNDKEVTYREHGDNIQIPMSLDILMEPLCER